MEKQIVLLLHIMLRCRSGICCNNCVTKFTNKIQFFF